MTLFTLNSTSCDKPPAAAAAMLTSLAAAALLAFLLLLLLHPCVYRQPAGSHFLLLWPTQSDRPESVLPSVAQHGTTMPEAADEPRGAALFHSATPGHTTYRQRNSTQRPLKANTPADYKSPLTNNFTTCKRDAGASPLLGGRGSESTNLGADRKLRPSPPAGNR